MGFSSRGVAVGVATLCFFMGLPASAQQGSSKAANKTAVNKEEVPATTHTSEAPPVLQQ